MRTCIAMGTYHNPGETFINHHIGHLFGGDTVILCARRRGEDVHHRPIHVRRPATGLAALASLPGQARNLLRHGSTQVPAGRDRAAIAAFLKREGVEVILTEYGTQALVLAPLASDLGIPCFTYFRGSDASRSLQTAKQARDYRRLMPYLSGIFAVSRHLVDNLARAGAAHPNTTVIPSGVETDLFVPEEKIPGRFLAVGRLVPKKAPLVTIRAFANATRGLPHTKLDIVGDGPLMEPCRALAQDLGAGDRITFHGRLPHDAVRTLLSRAEFFLQHSVTGPDGDTEGMPTAIQEALSAGAVTISTRHAGIPDAIEEGETGFLVGEHDAEGFAQAIAYGLHLGPRIRKMSTAARATALARFDKRTLLSELETHMRKTLA
ncbi:glycosyltransferase [Roseicyclus sp. F158]|uniref:Glycosyltransferase n=1 Tax=Tropicimonas omnivorans TaxID=3075590 RepID=A0ABU3DL28_9RHOB|nr:glycosyltransferase [Roseicyclus sp. F158]MDT0684408.1 glycosyltransferase [Roseicyclus sp. F158]